MESVSHKLNQEVDRSLFAKSLLVPAVRLANNDVSKAVAILKPILMAKRGKRNVYPDPLSNDFKLVALSDTLEAEEVRVEADKLLSDHPHTLSTVSVVFDYADYNYHEALKLLLPAAVTVPSGFETIGCIAHLNLRESQFPYKYLIGQVIRDKTKEVRTVVNKLDKLSNEYRTPELELISGVPEYETVVHEEKANLYVEFEKVYWCSRLSGERSRVIQTLKQSDIVCDAFCGVGPFAVRAAKEKGCRVYASDLNPYCYSYLVKNVKENKVGHLVEPANADARQYVQSILGRVHSKDILPVTRWFMNLPGDAVEFLDAFPAYYSAHPEHLSDESFKESKVHVYCFLLKDEEQAMRLTLVERVQQVLPNFDDSDVQEIHTLKSVSTDKDMCCLTFRLHAGNCDGRQMSQGEKKLKTD